MINKLFDKLVLTDTAALAHRDVVNYLTQRGFKCQCEYVLTNRGDGHKGRIDLIAIKNDIKLAIEIDCRTPRLNSIRKLKQMPKEYIKCIICRVVAPFRKINEFNIIYPIAVNARPEKLIPTKKEILMRL